MSAGIRAVGSKIPPAAKPRKDQQTTECALASYRVKKMNGKASLLASTRESGYAGEVSLGEG